MQYETPLESPERRTQKAVLDVELARLQEMKAAFSTQRSQQQADEQIENANEELAHRVMDTG